MNSPAKEQIRHRRLESGLSQTSAALEIYSTLRTWQDWEAGKAKMHPGLWELFLLKTAAKVACLTRLSRVKKATGWGGS